MTLAYLTVYDLYDAGACEDGIVAFQRLFGDAAAVTASNWRRAQRAGLSVTWCTRLLTDPAWAEYQRVTAPALAEYWRVRDQALLRALQESLA